MAGMQRAALVIAAALALGALAWLLVATGDGDGPALPPADRPAPSPAPRDPAPLQQGTRVPDPDRPPAPTPADPALVPAPPGQPPAAPTTLVLRVHDLAARTPVPTFRWQFRNANGTWRGTGDNGHANLGLPPANVGQLLVEAEGLAPFARDGVVAATPPQEPQPLDVFLGPLVPAAGITLHVRDLGLRPVANVRVDAFALADDAPDTGWQSGPSLWARRNTDANGRYVLPALQPGRYGIRVVATDGEGALLPLLPFHRVFVLSGDNGFVEDVALEPGALLALELFDAAGQPYDPARAGTATLRLQQLGGPPLARKWVVQQQGAAAAAIDVLPGVGKVMLAEALPHGQYTFEVLVNGALRVTRPLFLRPGLTHVERVDVP